MANGFFQGGLAEGAMGAQQQALRERTLNEDTALRSRGVDIQQQGADLNERQFNRLLSNDDQTRADALIAQNMTVIAETVKAGIAGGTPPDKIRMTVADMLRHVAPIAKAAGRDPNALVAQVEAQLSNPGPVATAAVTGTAEGTQQVEKERAIQQPNAPADQRVEINPYKTEKERFDAEKALRDDYQQQAKDFTLLRNFKDRMDSAPNTGAGDVGLVFSYMKILDTGSTVREGEFATARNAAGVPESVRAQYNRLVGGGLLSDKARKELRDAANGIMSTASSRHSLLTSRYSDIARRSKLNVRNVIVDPADNPTASPAASAPSAGEIPPPPPGFTIIAPRR